MILNIDTERDCSPDTTYNALVFDARDGQDLMWRFMVFNNLKVVDKVYPQTLTSIMADCICIVYNYISSSRMSVIWINGEKKAENILCLLANICC